MDWVDESTAPFGETFFWEMFIEPNLPTKDSMESTGDGAPTLPDFPRDALRIGVWCFSGDFDVSRFFSQSFIQWESLPHPIQRSFSCQMLLCNSFFCSS